MLIRIIYEALLECCRQLEVSAREISTGYYPPAKYPDGKLLRPQDKDRTQPAIVSTQLNLLNNALIPVNRIPPPPPNAVP